MCYQVQTYLLDNIPYGFSLNNIMSYLNLQKVIFNLYQTRKSEFLSFSNFSNSHGKLTLLASSKHKLLSSNLTIQIT